MKKLNLRTVDMKELLGSGRVCFEGARHEIKEMYDEMKSEAIYAGLLYSDVEEMNKSGG